LSSADYFLSPEEKGPSPEAFEFRQRAYKRFSAPYLRAPMGLKPIRALESVVDMGYIDRSMSLAKCDILLLKRQRIHRRFFLP
jgi:hypothetical protein